jgi:hypothetical protein
MAAVHEHQKTTRRRRARQTDGRRSEVKVCAVCKSETKWLSVDGMCWNCTVDNAKKKVPLHVDLSEEDQSGSDSVSDNMGYIDNVGNW